MTESDLIQKESHYRCKYLRRGHIEIGQSLNPIWVVFLLEDGIMEGRWLCEGRAPCEDGDRVWSVASANQGCLKQPKGGRSKEGSPL